jgi:hypothetical protein
MGAVVVLLLFWWAVGGLVGYAIGNSKGRAGEGLALGLLLGVIGWLIVAVMEPSEQVRQARQAETVALAASVGGTVASNRALQSFDTRTCPWCAESIKAAARVCRYCGRDVEPEHASIQTNPAVPPRSDALLEAVRDEFPTQYDEAHARLVRLDRQPDSPAEWLRELCSRVSSGAPMDAAASRIPLDWRGVVMVPPPKPQMPTRAVEGDAQTADDFPVVRESYPATYETARSFLAGLDELPNDPEAWLTELCNRIHQGAPPASAAARIPLNWPAKGSA